MPTIVEASPEYLERLFIPHDAPGPVRGFWTRHRNGVPPFEPKGFAVGVSRPAEVFEGQWIVRCDGCRNAQFTSRAEKRFFCVCCLNAAHGGQWVRVAWPKRADDIEAVLLARPLFQQRNYSSGETVAHLVAENREHRDPVPEGVS